MSRALGNRLRRIEATRGVGAGSESPRSIVVRFVRSTGEYGGEVCRTDRAEAAGRVWHREPGESEEAFEARVLAELDEHGVGSVLVVMHPVEE